MRFETWGTGPAAGLRGTVRPVEGQTAAELVVRRIEREVSLVCCGGPRLDATVDGVPRYQATFGRRVQGGYEPRSEVFFLVRKGTP